MRITIRTRIAGIALAMPTACALIGGANRARAAPSPGSFLVAARQQQGDFSRSVVFLVDYGPKGAFGLIVNRPTTLALAKFLPDVSELRGRGDSLYLGGPVSVDHLILLIRSKTAPPDAVHVVGDIYVSGSMTALRAVAGNRLAGADFRGYAGYAGWGPGQLDEEIADGDWVVTSAQADAIFTAQPGRLWDKLIQTQDTKLVETRPHNRTERQLSQLAKGSPSGQTLTGAGHRA